MTGLEVLLILTFGIFATLLVYPFLIYPLVLRLLPSQDGRKNALPPFESVSILCSARDEEKHLPGLLQTLELTKQHYPCLDIRIYNDASTDGTEDILRKSSSINSLHGTHPVGKAEGLKRLRNGNSSKILIFIDANILFEPRTIAAVLAQFADKDVGAVGVKTKPENTGGGSPVGSLYWRMEEVIRAQESRTGSMMGCDGAFWAIRSEVYPEYSAMESDDFRPSMEALLRGYRIVQAPDVEVIETSDPDWNISNRNRRIACGAWHAHRTMRARLAGLGPLDQFKYISHKFLRWFSGIWLLGAFASALALSTLWQLAVPFVLLIALGLGAAYLGNKPVLAVLRICEGFLTTTAGVADAMRGRSQATWTSSRSM